MIITRSEAIAQGLTDGELRGLVRTGTYRRMLRGVYADSASLLGEDEQRHRLRILAMARHSSYAVSHVSAAVVHGLPVSGADLSEIHAVRIGVGGNRHRCGRHVHSGRLSAEWVTSLDGLPLTSVARTVVDMARTQPRPASLAAADAALHQGLCTHRDLREALLGVAHHRGVVRARAVVALSDGRAESPGESWTRLALTDPSLPAMDLQISIYDGLGCFVARADGGFTEYGVLWEYDGRGKYLGEYDPKVSAVDAVLAEKRRESRMTELGWVVIRVEAADLRDPVRLRARAHAALMRSRRAGWMRPEGTSMPASPRAA